MAVALAYNGMKCCLTISQPLSVLHPIATGCVSKLEVNAKATVTKIQLLMTNSSQLV